MIDTMPNLTPDRNPSSNHFHQNHIKLDTYIYILKVVSNSPVFSTLEIRSDLLWLLLDFSYEKLSRLTDYFQLYLKLVVSKYFSAKSLFQCKLCSCLRQRSKKDLISNMTQERSSTMCFSEALTDELLADFGFLLWYSPSNRFIRRFLIYGSIPFSEFRGYLEA